MQIMPLVKNVRLLRTYVSFYLSRMSRFTLRAKQVQII